MASVTENSTVFMLSLDGRREPFVVTNPEITLNDMQKEVLDLFEKTNSDTWVSLILEKETFTCPDCQPLLLAENGDMLETIFYNKRKSNAVELKFRAEEDNVVTIIVERTMALRDLQKTLCKVFRQRFPLMSASVVCAGTSFDDFNDMPFVYAEEEEEVIVSFTRASDMYFFDQVFRRGGRPSAVGLLDDSLQ